MRSEQLYDPPPNTGHESFLDRLALKQIDRDIFTGWCHAGGPLRAFGGQVAAQALIAAGSTIEQQDRSVHSLHAYFLRPGRTTDHIVYLVDRPRDGRSFTTRRVKAVQYGETIFTMSVSFVATLQGPSHQARRNPSGGSQAEWMATIPDPDSLPDVVLPHADDHSKATAAALIKESFPEHRLLDFRMVSDETAQQVSLGRFDRMAWMRTREELPHDYLINVCALTYLSDLTLVGTVTKHHGGRAASSHLELASLDHAMWFHQRFQADQWLLFATDSPCSGAGHGLARGEVFTRDGVLVASAVQEILLRVPH